MHVAKASQSYQHSILGDIKRRAKTFVTAGGREIRLISVQDLRQSSPDAPLALPDEKPTVPTGPESDVVVELLDLQHNVVNHSHLQRACSLRGIRTTLVFVQEPMVISSCQKPLGWGVAPHQESCDNLRVCVQLFAGCACAAICCRSGGQGHGRSSFVGATVGRSGWMYLCTIQYDGSEL